MRPRRSQLELEHGEAGETLGIVAAPLRGRHVGRRHLAKSTAQEKVSGSLLGRAGEYASQPPSARLLDDAREQLRPDALALEPRNRVERDDLGRRLLAI